MTQSTEQLFDECVKDALNQAQVTIHRVINHVMDTFESHAVDAVSSKDRQRYHDLLIELRRSKATLSRSFLNQFTELLNTSTQPKGQSFDYADIDLDKVTLMDDHSMQEDVEVSQLIQQIEAKAEWEIRDVNSRMSALKGGGRLDPKDNPMRPELFGRSLQRAVQSVPIGGEERMVLLRSFGAALSGALKDTYTSYSKKLQAKNIKPMQYGVRGTGAAASAAAMQAAQHLAAQAQALQGMTHAGANVGAGAGTSAGTAAPAMPNMFTNVSQNIPANMPANMHMPAPVGAEHLIGYTPDQIERLMRGRQQQGGSYAPQQQRGFAESMMREGGPSSFFGNSTNDALRGMLNKVVMSGATQSGLDSNTTNLITQYREDFINAAQKPIERLTIDVVAMMFDHILADVRLLAPVKAALGRLQIPVLRMALADATLFSSRQHPTRRLINRVASYSLGYTKDTDPHFSLFLSVVNAEVQTLASDESEEAQLYTKALENIELVITQINQDATRASDDTVKLLERAELRTVMRSSIAHHLAMALATVEVDEYLRDFMSTQWALVLVECIMRYGEDTEETRLYKQTASDLIWSVQPKVTSHDRQHLVKMLPLLVKQVRSGLALVDWADYTASDQQKFFSQLMSSHAKAVKAEAPARAAKVDASVQAWQAKVAEAWGGTLELDSPAALSEVVLAAVEKDATSLIDTGDISSAPSLPSVVNGDAVASPTQSGAVEFVDTQMIEAESGQKPKPEFVPSIPQLMAQSGKLSVDVLEVGVWYEMKLHGDWNHVQLFWKSPKNLFFMFNSNVGGKSHSITRRALEKLCNDNNLRVIESDGLIDRAVADVMASAHAAKENRATPKL
jgi:Protein of unknown function (DUF1631)